uniref:50S ribosomal protein L21, chloroplastic n=1 Tax=Hildenbrandia rivularis TaxID=135206 RepID=A0A1C9CFK8_9FLOR|nr:ribosomal protein L21 [Hildenbrandia rivularis]AOM67159.1 ribosomal protein L21 [Hildenbrandia rivularis]
MTYAIVDISGHQLLIKPGCYYDLNKIPLNTGEIVLFNKILLLNHKGLVKIGNPCLENVRIKATIVRHLKARKVTVFKLKSKKRLRRKYGHRQHLTRLVVNSIYVNNIEV